MKKLTLLFAVLCFAAPLFAGPKEELDLPRVSDHNSMVYFNGTGTTKFEHDGRAYTARIDIDFENPVGGRYGTMIVYDSLQHAVATFAMTKVDPYTDPMSKRVTLEGIDGTSGRATVNLDFYGKTDRNYSMLFFFDTLTYFETAHRYLFDSELRIAPRVKSAEEIAKDAEQQKITDRHEAERQRAKDRKTFRKNLYNTVGGLALFAAVVFAIWMLPRARRHQRVPGLILFTALFGWASTFPPFLFLPVLPAYFVWYRGLYNEEYGNYYLTEQFKRVAMWSFAVMAVIAYLILGWLGIVFAVAWAIAGFLTYLFVISTHTENARCPHCCYYGPNEIVDREFVDQQIFRTTTRKKVFTNTEERDNETIHWYKIKYNVRIEADQHFRAFRRCEHCEEIFITFYTRTKVLSDKDY